MKKDDAPPIKILHTLRVEMIGGQVLLYRLDARAKKWLENFLSHRTDDLERDLRGNYVSFDAKPDRYVFIRIKDIARLIFCWDATQGPEGNPYHDNFGVLAEPDPSLDLDDDENPPSVIIKLKGVKEPLVFDSLDPKTDCLYLDDQSFERPRFLKHGFINLTDEDGEENYIPVANISCIETARQLIYPDELWNEILHRSDLDERQN